VEEAERSKVERQMDLEQRMKAQVKAWQEKLHDIKKDVVAHTKARDREAKEVQKAEHTKWRVNDSLKSKKSAIEESTKSLSHLEQQLKEYSSAYEMVKTERNKTMSLIQHASQIQTELREKVHVLENEKEILRTAVDNKEKLLQKCALVHSHKVMERDTLRQEMSRKVNLQSDLSGEMEQQRSTIERLLNKINEAEAAMNQLRKRYESAVQERNEEGLKLIERNEELSIFYEKLNLQDSILQKASLQLKCREDDIHFLNMEIAELKRAISVCRKQTKDKKKLENDVVRHQIELLEAHESLLSLEKLVETPREARVRQLEGSDLTHGELQEKIEDLENKVADADEKLLEKELLHDQINRITERLDSKMKGVKTSGLNAAEKVLSYKLKIEEVTRKMMALVSELTMQQAKARQMQQEVSEQESELEAAYSRLQSGDAPTDCIAEEWLRMERTQNMRRQETLTKKQAAAREDQYTLPDGTVSTANPRPNAYLPQGEMDLPLPKPYGALAPFRPSQPGSTMRHIRKPVPKPIDI
jgi:chromosome segregation ATPase